MDDKILNMSLADLGRIQRRLGKLQSQEEGHMIGLERAADNCWEYPGADEKYEQLSNEMVELEKKLEILSGVKETIDNAIAKLRALLSDKCCI
ncbi:hypothetical protein SAMN04488494_3148 [Xylanibacter ruminicola]|jgi:hypothetical protein|uniref:Uncharacterized protein n=1 Tax=Xylanibacter ruminicola TaxID=839 RepID=A0A1M7NA43_XYLRU|nr:hypothetical protein [Xylanibacter ruminicola]SHN00372.1 hypothetical protein SAMN04488494_3148 [Xylanibacter ruminicola]